MSITILLKKFLKFQYTIVGLSYTFPDTDHENMSRNYLQELFGSFPFNAAGDNEMPDANISDGEYEIYEHYSDENYSNDDEY